MFSLSFLNSGILFLSASVVIPILIYLFAKKKPRKIIFSSIKFIKLSQKQQRKKINLKNLLLLLIRILIILFTVLAISRPSIKSEYLSRGTSHPKTAVAVIIDNSYSMDYLIDTKTELEKAKDIAIAINEILSENDVTVLFSLNSNWNEIHANLRYGRLPEDLIRSVSLTAVMTPLKEVLKKAESKLKESHIPNQEIYVITDLQEQPLPDNLEIPTYLIAASDNDLERSNISCENSHVINEIVGNKNNRKVQFDVVNHSQLQQNDIIIQLNLNGHKTSEKVLDLQPGQKKTDTFEINLEQDGWLTGFVEVKNERLTFDNRNYFTFYFNPDPRVAIITDLTQLPLALTTLLEIYTGEPANITLIDTDDFNYDYLQEFDNIIVYKKQEINQRLSFMIDKLIQNKKGILFITDPLLSEKWRGKLADLFSLSFVEFLNEGNQKISSFINPYHPITEIISQKKNLEFGQIWSVKSDANILIQAQDYPLVLEHNQSILWLFDIADLRNPFLIDSAFPVFAYNCLQFMVSSSISNSSHQAGDRFKLMHDQIILPSGDLILWNQESYVTNEPGIYYFNQQPVAVNLDYTESFYEKIAAADQGRIKILAADWEQNILQSRYGFEIWKILLLAVLFLFILEMLLVKSEEKK
ncbi:MAG: hypothetical protein APR54_02200, partial [Candidatus Cloacimonas sp. SDB]